MPSPDRAASDKGEHQDPTAVFCVIPFMACFIFCLSAFVFEVS